MGTSKSRHGNHSSNLFGGDPSGKHIFSLHVIAANDLMRDRTAYSFFKP
jgi:hypothetical protein